MYVNVIYKETITPLTKQVSKVEIIELEEDEHNAIRYAKLYGLQLPTDERGKVNYKSIQVEVS